VTAVRAKLDVPTCETVIAGAMRAWINGDGVDFASHFTEDADLVNIHGMHIRGRQAIAMALAGIVALAAIPKGKPPEAEIRE